MSDKYMRDPGSHICTIKLAWHPQRQLCATQPYLPDKAVVRIELGKEHHVPFCELDKQVLDLESMKFF